MDFGLSYDDVFLVWKLINHVMSCTITSTKKKNHQMNMFVCHEENKNFANPENIISKRDKWNVQIIQKLST